jgi:hypothetical protein
LAGSKFVVIFLLLFQTFNFLLHISYWVLNRSVPMFMNLYSSLSFNFNSLCWYEIWGSHDGRGLSYIFLGYDTVRV